MTDLEKKTVTDADGNEVEVYDAAQVEGAIKDTETKFTEEKTALENDLKEKTEAFDKLDEKDKDFGEVRDAKEKAEKDLTEANEGHTKEVDELKGKITSLETKDVADHKDGLVNVYAEGDKDMKDKIEHHMKTELSGMPETTKEEIDAKTKAAFKLAAEDMDQDQINSVISSAGDFGASPTDGEEVGGVSKELVDVGKNFGLSDEDFKNAKDTGEI